MSQQIEDSMDHRIDQCESSESRPNLCCDDGTLFIYNRDAGIYEPYKKSEEDNYDAAQKSGKDSGNRFAKHWQKHWPIWVPAIINLLTLTAVCFYTYFAREQACAAIGAVKATNRAIETNRKSANLDVRAWVSVYDVHRDLSNRDYAIVDFENKGKTPASNFSVIAGAGPSTESEEKKLPGRGIVAPDVTYHSAVPVIGQGNQSAYVHGNIEYDSIFGNKHWTRFCSREFPKTANSPGGFGPCESGNEIDPNDP
jgi:hypothetical protein